MTDRRCAVSPRAPHWQVTRRFANHCRQRQEQSVLQVRDCRPVRGAGRHRRRSSPFRCPVLAEPILHQPWWRTEVWRRDPSCTSAGCVRKLTRERQRRCDGRLLDIRGARPGRGCWRGYFSTPRIAPPHAVQSSFAAASTMGVQLAGCRSQCCAPSISVPTLWPTSLSLWCVATPTLSIAAANMVMLLRVIIGVFPCFGLTPPALLCGLFRSLCKELARSRRANASRTHVQLDVTSREILCLRRFLEHTRGDTPPVRKLVLTAAL